LTIARTTRIGGGTPEGARSSDAIKVWGLTGGAASGKSTVAGIFAKNGVPVIDADQLARELAGPGGRAEPLIEKRFGKLGRAELRALVFSDPAARKDLEAILHPLIGEESRKRMDALAALGHKHVVYEASLLIEAGRAKEFDGLLVVVATPELQLQRLQTRPGITPELAQGILNAQLKDVQREAVATHVFRNTGSPEELERQVLDWLARNRDPAS
jgi:dephospho-CoA kinase